MTRVRYFPDLVNAVVALVVGIVVALFLHNKWYYGGRGPAGPRLDRASAGYEPRTSVTN